MKVILKDKVKSLGGAGEIVNVSAGYARNFLFPKELAVLADDSSTKQLNHMNKVLAKKVAGEKSAAEELKGKLNGLTLELVKRVGTNGRLFGTVTTVELSKELEAKGINVERRVISLETPIKAVGSFKAKAKLHTGVEAEFGINVVIDPKQAEEMKKKEAEAAKKKEADKVAAELAAAEKKANGEEDTPAAEMTEEQKLKAEADALLRS